ncbi:hypothetical protein HW555_012357, partial [Spodoptera exigua]
MAGQELDDNPKLKGFNRLFNSQTNRGRANTSKVTLGLIAASIVYFKFLKGNKSKHK